MTRKHFRKIASILRERRADPMLIRDFATMCALENEYFDLVDLGVHEQLMAIRMGLTDDPRKEDPANIPLTDHQPVRVWE
jgi:hypothetical protein